MVHIAHLVTGSPNLVSIQLKEGLNNFESVLRLAELEYVDASYLAEILCDGGVSSANNQAWVKCDGQFGASINDSTM